MKWYDIMVFFLTIGISISLLYVVYKTNQLLNEFSLRENEEEE